jgi:hypothetical protein
MCPVHKHLWYLMAIILHSWQIFYHILKDLHFFNAIFLQCHAVVLGKNINKNNKLNNKITKKKTYRPHNHNFSYPLKFEDLEIVFGGREVFSTKNVNLLKCGKKFVLKIF